MTAFCQKERRFLKTGVWFRLMMVKREIMKRKEKVRGSFIFLMFIFPRYV